MRKIVKASPESWRVFVKSVLPNPLRAAIQSYVGNWAPFVIMSYPKCGRTWLRLLITRAAYEAFPPMPLAEDVFLDFGKLNRHAPRVPLMQLSHDDCQFNTPEGLERCKKKFAKSNILFLVRDPRDVVVSWYFQSSNRSTTSYTDMKTESLADYLHNNRGGLKTIIEFYNIWASERNSPKSFKLMKYEDLRQDPRKMLREYFEFAGCSALISDEAIDKSVEYNAFQKMKQREESGKYNHPAMMKGNGESNSSKTRRGKVGGYVDYLDDEAIAFMNRYIDENLDPYFQYQTTS